MRHATTMMAAATNATKTIMEVGMLAPDGAVPLRPTPRSPAEPGDARSPRSARPMLRKRPICAERS
jgi:hypothetical protein